MIPRVRSAQRALASAESDSILIVAGARNVRRPVAAGAMGGPPGRDLHSTSSLSQQTPFEAEVAALIAQAVNLPSPPEAIDPTAALFGAGLGLDSIDLLEIALAVTQRYGCELRSDDPDNARIFASLRNLAAHIAERQRS